MKRNTLIAVVLCLMMITIAGAGAASAKQDENPRQAGESSVYFYDVEATDTHGKGKLMVDLKQHTYVFNGQGFLPSQQIELRAFMEPGDIHYILLASEQANPSGNLHIAGTWEWEAEDLPAEVVTGYPIISGMTLFNGGAFVVQLRCYYSFDGGGTWHDTSGAIKDISLYQTGYACDLADLGVPPGDLVKIHAVVIGGKDRTGSEVFQYEPSGTNYSECAQYDIYGYTWNPDLQYWGVWEPNSCDESP